MKVSLCMPWRNRVNEAKIAFPTWARQEPDEIVVVDDGSTDGTKAFLEAQPLGRTKFIYERLPDKGYSRSPLRAFNRCMELASGDVLIQQSPEVVHLSPDLIARLAGACPATGCAFARTFNAPADLVAAQMAQPAWQFHRFVLSLCGHSWGNPDARTKQHDLPEPLPAWQVYTGIERPLPFFFCGAIRQSTWFEIGGYDEEMKCTFDRGADAAWAEGVLKAQRFVRGLGDVIAVHLKHGRS